MVGGSTPAGSWQGGTWNQVGRYLAASKEGRRQCFTEMCSGSEEGSYSRIIDFCITQF